jgi:hypothetical protein
MVYAKPVWRVKKRKGRTGNADQDRPAPIAPDRPHAPTILRKPDLVIVVKTERALIKGLQTATPAIVALVVNAQPRVIRNGAREMTVASPLIIATRRRETAYRI